MYRPKISSFHIETLILLEKYETIIDYINECNLFPEKTVVLVDKTKPECKIIDIKTLTQ